MTPFGVKMRSLRRKRGLTIKEQGLFLGVSPAYISALEHGKRGRPSRLLSIRFVSGWNLFGMKQNC